MSTDNELEQKQLEQKAERQKDSKQSAVQQKSTEQDATQQKAPWTAKRVAAVIGIVLLVALYVLTLVSALIGTEGANRLFKFSLGMTIAVPIFLWIFIWCIGKFQNKRNMASLDILSSNPKEREKMEKAILREMGKGVQEETTRQKAEHGE